MMRHALLRTPHVEFRTPSWLFAFYAGSALWCCSCTTVKSMARTEDFSEEVQRAKQLRAQQVASAQPSVPPETTSAGVVRLGGSKSSETTLPAAYTLDDDVQYYPSGPEPKLAQQLKALKRYKQERAIQLASHEETCPPDAITVCPPEPRLPVAGPNPNAIGMPAMEFAEMPHPESFPDEYLCDGGDRDWPVHYNESQRLGLDTEDTVAEYVDHKGRERMKPSSKVCIYAPRFAAVRTVSQPVLGDSLSTSVGMINTTFDGELRTRLTMTQKTKRDAVGGLRMRSRASGIETEAIGAGITQDVAAVQHDKINNLFQSYNFTVAGDLEQEIAARLNYGLGAAAVWTRDASPVISGQVEQAVEGLFEVSVHTVTVIDDAPSDEPGQLQIAKFADKQDAKPGDVITFTIRYRNAGPREVHYVRIVDNLTPRLAYVDDSATSDRDGRLDVEDNGEGSLVMTWEFNDTLPPDTAGVVTFQARVR